MAVDQGQRDDYLRTLKDAILSRRERLARVKEKLKLVKMEDDAEALLSPAQRTLLSDAGVTRPETAAALTTERDNLTTLIDAMVALSDAVRTLN